eukprot:m.15869 g.15869  ORF g.15869 m.15869 type:complete len:66 (+) comp26589_c0_seq4:562-759(+)
MSAQQLPYVNKVERSACPLTGNADKVRIRVTGSVSVRNSNITLTNFARSKALSVAAGSKATAYIK